MNHIENTDSPQAISSAGLPCPRGSRLETPAPSTFVNATTRRPQASSLSQQSEVLHVDNGDFLQGSSSTDLLQTRTSPIESWGPSSFDSATAQMPRPLALFQQLDLNEVRHGVAFSPDKRQFAARLGGIDFVIWKEEQGKFEPVQSLTGHPSTVAQRFSGIPSAVTSIAYSFNGNQLASGGCNGSIRTFDSRQGRFECSQTLRVYPTMSENLTGGMAVVCVTFSPNGHWLVSGHRSGNIRIWEKKQGKFEQVQLLKCYFGDHLSGVTAHERRSRWITFLSDGYLAVDRQPTSRDGSIHIFKYGHDQFIWAHAIRYNILLAVNGNHLACTNSDKSISIWTRNGLTFTETQNLASEERVASAAFSCDGRQLASGSIDSAQIQVWAMKDDGQFELVRINRHNNHWTHSLAFLSDGRIASVYLDGKRTIIRFWELGV